MVEGRKAFRRGVGRFVALRRKCFEAGVISGYVGKEGLFLRIGLGFVRLAAARSTELSRFAHVSQPRSCFCCAVGNSGFLSAK